MTHDEFYYNLTPRQFANAVQGYFDHYYEQQKSENIRARKIAHSVLLPHVKNPLSFHEWVFWPFPWDRQGLQNAFDIIRIPSKEKMERIRQIHERNMMLLKKMDPRERRKIEEKIKKERIKNKVEAPSKSTEGGRQAPDWYLKAIDKE